MENDIFKDHERLVDNQVIVQVEMENSLGTILFSGYIMNEYGQVLDAVLSLNSFKEALYEAVKKAERFK